MHGPSRTTDSKPTVLIVSHAPSIRQLLVEMLSFEGYPTQTAANAEECLELLHQARESRLVMLHLDIYPDMWELMDLLHENRFLRAHHRIIQVDVDFHVEQARPLEPDDKLLIPFSLAPVMDVVERNAAALRRRKAR